MASDENESKKPSDPLPPSVERALAKARAAAGKARAPRSHGDGDEPDAAPRSGRWLALIPATAAILALLLMMPRSVPPEDVPLPQIDARALEAIRNDDDQRAAAANLKRLPGEVLLVGTALRAMNKLQATAGNAEDMGIARADLDNALRGIAPDKAQVIDGLRTLRAIQLAGFLAEVARFEQTGKPSAELDELSGGFIPRMAAGGWVIGNKVILDDAQRRAAFKLVWTAMVGGEQMEGLALGLDEQRVLYTLYITHPHAAEAERQGFEAMGHAAATPADCERIMAKERSAIERWRADKIKRLGAIDPTYPTAYALGVSHYRAGHYDQSLEAFRAWLNKHPEGPLSLRARNHLKAALAANGPS